MTIRVMLVDDHRILRDGLRALLDGQPEMAVVAEAAEGEEAIRLAGEARPDVIIMDINLAGLNGLDATRRLRVEHPGIKVLALSMHLRKTYVKEMLKAGAVGYILKEGAATEVIEAIHQVMAGHHYLCRRVTDLIAADYAADEDSARAEVEEEGLSGRDVKIIRLLSAGRSSKEIAYAMGLSVKTIDAARRRIMETLNCSSLAELVKYAIRENLTSVDE